MSSRRTFSRTEADDVFKVALELERQSLASGTDLSAAQLESIGVEVGISPERVREAISMIDSPPITSSRLFGAPRVICLQREFVVTAAPDRDDDLIDWLRRQVGVHGVVSREGNTLIWTGQRQYSMLRVTLIRSREGMRLRIVQNHSAFLTAVFGGLLGFGGLLTVAAVFRMLQLASTNLYIAMVAGWAVLAVTVAWVLARTITRSRVRRDVETLTKLLSELSGLLE